MALPHDTEQTLIIVYVCTGLAMCLMALRLILRKYRGQAFDLSDKLTMACMFCLLARLGFIHVVLIWGSNNLPESFRENHVFGPEEIYQRIIGSKLTLVNRTVYNTYIWLQKCIVLLLYKRILWGLAWTNSVMKIYWGVIAATYVVVQVVTFTDCRPIYLYWQVVPDPGTCSEALSQLIILGALNILTDLMLIVLPMPALIGIRRSLPAKIRLICLFSLGFFLVAITIIRLPINFSHGTAQVNRTTWASVESFTAAVVANIPAIYTLRRRTPNFNTGVGTGGPGTGATSRVSHSSDVDGWLKMDNRSTTSQKGEEGHSDTTEPELDQRKRITVRRSVELEERRKESGESYFFEADEKHASWDQRARIMRATSSLSDIQVEEYKAAWAIARSNSEAGSKAKSRQHGSLAETLASTG